MLDTSPFTDEQWCAMVDAKMWLPEPLHKITCDAWVYDRKWGVFPVSSGYHYIAMTTLRGFHSGHDRAWTKPDEDTQQAADDYLLTIPGTCFLSSIGTRVIAGRRSHLTTAERLALKQFNITYLEND